MDWYYAQNNQQKGPLSQRALEDLFEYGGLDPDALVWREGMRDWEPASGLPAFQSFFARAGGALSNRPPPPARPPRVIRQAGAPPDAPRSRREPYPAPPHPTPRPSPHIRVPTREDRRELRVPDRDGSPYATPYTYPDTGYHPPMTNGLAIASLILALLSPLCFSIITAIPAVICGHIARGQIAQSRGRETGEGLAMAGLIIGYAVIGLLAVVMVFAAIA